MSDQEKDPGNSLPFILGKIARCKSLKELTSTTAFAARELTNADGASFIIREDDNCYYLDENAVSPLWSGKRFPIYTCISGWAMVHAETVSIEDIYSDGRIPIEAYKPTFVKSLLMTPIISGVAIGAIGTYWAETHIPTEEEIKIIESIAIANAAVLPAML